MAEESTPEEIDPQTFIRYVTESDNIAADMSDLQLGEIARQAIDDYQLDKDTMAEWFQLMERGLDLAKLVKDGSKDYPFKNASDVKYPLITSAALQFNARAYPAIVPEDRPVKARVWGKDEGGKKAERADRVSEHMSYQLQAKVPEWERETDKLLVQLPIVGEMFRKWWYDPVLKRPKCRLIEPGKLIVNNEVTDFQSAPRCTEEFSLFPHEIETRIRSGRFVEFDIQEDDDKQAAQDFIEHHCRLDLDEDGYEEPYIVTVYVPTEKVVSIVADFEQADVEYETETRMVPSQQMAGDPATGQVFPIQVMMPQEIPVRILSITRNTYFQEFQFWPGIGGGFHGTGLGLLLGDISESINTIINMMLDAGHYASLGGGFIGSEFRLKGSAQRFRPGEWKQVPATGMDVRSGIVPMTFPGPDGTLFQMLGMLIDAGREIASVKDVITGEQPRQQQTATTTLALIEQGMMVFTAAYKRIFRSCKTEYGLLAKINKRTVSREEYMRFHDEEADPQADYDESDMDIQPVADPRSVTKMQQAAKAQFIMQLSEMGLVDRAEALTRITEAMDVEDVEDLLPKPDPMAQQMQMLQFQGAQAELANRMADVQLTLAKVREAEAAVVEKLAGAQSDEVRAAIEAEKVQIDEMRMMLEAQRGRLETIFRGAERMAGASGNGGPAQGYAGPVGSPEVGAFPGMVPGQPGF